MAPCFSPEHLEGCYCHNWDGEAHGVGAGLGDNKELSLGRIQIEMPIRCSRGEDKWWLDLQVLSSGGEAWAGDMILEVVSTWMACKSTRWSDTAT